MPKSSNKYSWFFAGTQKSKQRVADKINRNTNWDGSKQKDVGIIYDKQ